MLLAHLPEPWCAGWAPFARSLEKGAAGLGLAPLAGFAGWLADELELACPGAPPIEQAVAGVLGGPVAAEPLTEGPFARLVRLVPGSSGGRRPRALLVAPCSGYAASVLAELAATLLLGAELAVLEWRDARLVPAAAGPWGAAEQAAEAGAAVACYRPDLVVAVSQAGDAALAACLAARAAGPDGPAGLVLLGTPMLPEHAPTALQRSLALVPEATLAALCLVRVAGGWPGSGRLVFPGRLQLSTVAASDPWSYGAVRLGALAERLDGRAGPRSRALSDLHALQDVPGELWSDLVARLRASTPALGEPARAASAGLALLTVEAAADQLVGSGQTHGLHERLAPGRVPRARLTLPGAAHPDLFTGPTFRALLAPRLLGFLATLADRRAG